MIKKLTALFCVFLCLLHCSCFDSAEQKEREQRIRETFSEFYAENDIVYVYGTSSFHFNTHSVHLYRLIKTNGLIPDKKEYSIPLGGVWFEGDKVYFSVYREDELYQKYSFLLYECDLYGNNMKLVYEKNEYTRKPFAIAKDGVFYIENSVKLDTAKYGYVTQIDTYDLSTGKYTPSIAIGEDCSWKDYYEQNTTWENVDYEQGYFDILLPGETESIIIDDDFINSTIYADSMNKYPYTPIKWGIVEGRVLLVYKLWASVGFDYAHVVYEYDVENHELIYKMLGFWGDDLSDHDFRFIK